MITDFKYAFRMLLKSPAFTLIAVVTLALGIGANTAIFTVINGVLLRPLPYADSAQIVTLKSQQSVPELEDISRQNASFESIGGLGSQGADYSGGSEPLQLELGLVSGDFFRVLGARAALGRLISAEEDRFGAAPVLVLSHALWQRQFGGESSVLGRSIRVAGQSYTVIGVTAANFKSPRGNLDAFVPIHVFYPVAAKSRGAHLLRVYAKLKPEVTMTTAQNELRVIDQRLASAFPDEDKERASTLISLHEQMVGEVRPALMVLFGAVGLLLVIACANFANLLLVRVAARQMELTIRAALGAGRWSLVRQLLVESLLLSLLGGAAGLLLGSWGVDALLALKPADLPRAESISLDWPVLCFALGLSLLTGIIFGILPAWQATRVDASGIIPSASRNSTPARSRLRDVLVVTELGLALVLLIGAGLLGKTFWRLTSVSPGFQPDHLLTMRVEMPEARYKEIPRQTQFREAILANMNALPGLEAAIISELPLGGNAISHNFIIEGRTFAAVGEEPELYSRSVAGDYFKIMGIPLVQGRSLTSDDRANAPAAGVINQSMLRQYFREQNPIGTRIRWARNEGVDWITIVGVVGNVRHFGLGQNEEPAIYTPYAQSGQAWKRWSEIVVRTGGKLDRKAVTAQVKNALWKVDPLLPITEVRSMNEIMSESLVEQSFNALLLGVFAAVALLLAGVGLYGVLAFTVAQRTREIGIRMALGAQARDVLRLILRQGLTLTLIGVSAGILVSLGCTRVLAGVLFGVAPTDATTFAALSFLLIVVAFAACYIPARRAMKVHPMVALRYE